MRVPALFQLCSSKAEKFSVDNQRCSSCSSCSSTFARVCAKTRKHLFAHVFFSRAYVNHLERVEHLEHSCFYWIFCFVKLEHSWNTAGTQS